MKNMTDEQILDYLMTSDFEDNLSPEEFRSLLNKFRMFYRVVSSRSTNTEMEKKRFNFEIEQLNLIHAKKENELNEKINFLNQKYEKLISKKLTFKERLFGKIKIQED